MSHIQAVVNNLIPNNLAIYAKAGSSDGVRKHGFGVISLFTGGGGLDLGLEEAGFETRVAVEIDAVARATIRRNRPEWNPLEDEGGNITRISTARLLSVAGLEEGQTALVVGGAPCQPFSNMGKKLGSNSEDGTLFREFVRVVSDARPQGFVFENVQGIAQNRHSAILKYFSDEFGRLGYGVSMAILNAADYGVPQTRRRMFILGLRGVSIVGMPGPTHSANPDNLERHLKFAGVKLSGGVSKHVTVGEVFAKLRATHPPAWNYTMNIGETVRERMRYIGPGQNFHVLPDHLRPNCWKTGRHQGADTFGRLRVDQPSVTIRTCAYNPTKGRYIHPTEDRGLSTVEMAALQDFVPDWHFEGSLVSIGRQIGNAVPRGLARAVGTALGAQMLSPIERGGVRPESCQRHLELPVAS